MLSSLLTIIIILKKPYFNIKINKKRIKIQTFFIGAFLGALILILFQFLNFSQVFRGLIGTESFSPLGILILFFSMVFISIYLDTTGFFEYCARIALKYAGNSGKKLFFTFYIIVSFLTVFTSNDIVILTFTPFIYYFTKAADLDPKPYLISEFFAANTWSMALYIGNPTNILLSSAFGLTFDEYSKWMFFPTVIAGLVNLLLLYIIFRKNINIQLKTNEGIVPSEALKDKRGALIGLIFLISVISALIIIPYFGVQMWIISFIFALGLLIFILLREILRKIKNNNLNPLGGTQISNIIKKLPWEIIPFLLSLFILIEALKIYGISQQIGVYLNNLCGDSVFLIIIVFGFSSALTANLINNIPMSVVFVPIIQEMSENGRLFALFATIIGSNLGANISLIGALAGIMWINILREKDYKLSFWDFLKYGLIITPITLLATLLILYLEFFIF